jgi:hypothetical protein
VWHRYISVKMDRKGWKHLAHSTELVTPGLAVHSGGPPCVWAGQPALPGVSASGPKFISM